MQKSFMNPRFYQYARTFRVDLEGNGDFNTIKDACDTAATILPRDTFNRVLIEVNDGIYVEEPFTVPTHTSITSYGNQVQRAVPGVFIVRGIGGTINPAETDFITLAGTNLLSNIHIQTGLLPPANFNTEYAVLRVLGLADLAEVDIAFSSSSSFPYNGANPAYNIKRTGATAGALTVQQSWFEGTGTGLTFVWSDRPYASYYNIYFDSPNIVADLSHTGGVSFRSAFVHDRLVAKPGDPDRSPKTWFIRTSAADTHVHLYSTRVPLNLRTGPGLFVEVHPTPQQLGVAFQANSRVVVPGDPVAARTFDAYTDGTIEADTTAGVLTVFAPVYANAILGQRFTLKRIGASIPTLDGNGVLIDGVATHTIPVLYDALIIEKNSRGSWSLV